MAARDLAIYEKQILEGILESLYGHQGFSNLRKAGPLRVFIVRSPRRVQCPSF